MRDPYLAPWQHLAAAVGMIVALVASANIIASAIDEQTYRQAIDTNILEGAIQVAAKGCAR